MSAIYEAIPGERISPLYRNLVFNTRPFEAPAHPYAIAVIGPSGAGKESRGEYLTSHLHLDSRISSGDIFRRFATKLESQSPGAIEAIKQWRKGYKDINTIRAISLDEGARAGVYRDLGIVAQLTGMESRALLQQLSGLFVDDDILFHYTRDQLSAVRRAQKGIALDGHFRTQPQSEYIGEMLADANIPLVAAFVVHTPLEVLRTRTVGRLSCVTCKLPYNTECDDQHPRDMHIDKSGLRNGYCKTPTCDPVKPLRRRDDDMPNAVNTRLHEYETKAPRMLETLAAQGVSLGIISGNLNPFSKSRMHQSVKDTISASPAAMSYFS